MYGLTHLEQWKWDTWEDESRKRRAAEEAAAPPRAAVAAEPPHPLPVHASTSEDSIATISTSGSSASVLDGSVEIPSTRDAPDWSNSVSSQHSSGKAHIAASPDEPGRSDGKDRDVGGIAEPPAATAAVASVPAAESVPRIPSKSSGADESSIRAAPSDNKLVVDPGHLIPQAPPNDIPESPYLDSANGKDTKAVPPFKDTLKRDSDPSHATHPNSESTLLSSVSVSHHSPSSTFSPSVSIPSGSSETAIGVSSSVLLNSQPNSSLSSSSVPSSASASAQIARASPSSSTSSILGHGTPSQHIMNSYPLPPPLPPPPSPTGGESIYRTIMNRLTALEGNTTLYARYVEEQTASVREMLRRLSEDVGRIEGIVCLLP